MQLIVSNPSEKEKIRMREDARRDEITTFGEGVDRKCRELEDIGLPAPIFNNSTFIFKTTVMSASFQEQLMEDASIQRKNALIEN